MRLVAVPLGRLAICVVIGTAVCAACTSTPTTGHSVASPRASTQAGPAVSQQASAAPAHTVPGGCGGTQVLAGAPPSWNPEPAGFTPGPPSLPYVLGSGGSVMGYLWAHPLYSPESGSRRNKVLWFVRYARNGSPLRVTGHLNGDPARTVSESFPDNASPGEIYPSYMTAPQPGCWTFTLRWAGHTDHLSLLFTALPHH